MCPGVFLSCAHFRDHRHRTELYVLNDTCKPVIGQDLMIRLQMQVDCGTKQVHHAKYDSKVTVPMERSSGSRAEWTLEAAFPPNRYGGTPGNTVPPLVSNPLACSPELISMDIGMFPGFQHRIKLVPDAVPVAVKTQQVPCTIEGKVADVVLLLDEHGIWEKADKGDWVIL